MILIKPYRVCFLRSDAPVMLINAHDSWPLTKLEIADGFYSPWCATVRYVIDHFAAAVLLSFAVVSVAHAGFWGDFISGDIGSLACGLLAHQPLPRASQGTLARQLHTLILGGA